MILCKYVVFGTWLLHQRTANWLGKLCLMNLDNLWAIFVVTTGHWNSKRIFFLDGTYLASERTKVLVENYLCKVLRILQRILKGSWTSGKKLSTFEFWLEPRCTINNRQLFFEIYNVNYSLSWKQSVKADHCWSNHTKLVWFDQQYVLPLHFVFCSLPKLAQNFKFLYTYRILTYITNA